MDINNAILGRLETQTWRPRGIDSLAIYSEVPFFFSRALELGPIEASFGFVDRAPVTGGVACEQLNDIDPSSGESADNVAERDVHPSD